MSELMNISDLMKISVLGYNFADWVKQFKKAFKQSDGTYDYMAYFAQLNNPVSFFLLDGRLGVDEANAFLNSVITPTMNSIEVVGGRKQKGGCGPMCQKMFTIIFILLLFMSSIDSSLAGPAQDKYDAFKKRNPKVNLEIIEEPIEKVGWLWNTKPTKKQMDEYNAAVAQQNELKQLISAAESEAEQNKFAHEETMAKMDYEAQEVAGQQSIISKAIDTAKDAGNIVARVVGDKIDALMDLANKGDKYADIALELMATKAQTNLYLFGTTAACGMFALYYWATNRKNMKLTMIQVQYFWPQIQAGLDRGEIRQITNPRTGMIEYYTSPAVADTLARTQDIVQLAAMGYGGPPAAALGIGQNAAVRGQNVAGLGPPAAGPIPGFGPRQAAPYGFSAPPAGPPGTLLDAPPRRPAAEGGRRRTRKVKKLRKSKKTRNSKRR